MGDFRLKIVDWRLQIRDRQNWPNWPNRLNGFNDFNGLNDLNDFNAFNDSLLTAYRSPSLRVLLFELIFFDY